MVIEGGRQHQIRAHLALFGTPLVGDKLYLHGEDFFLAYQDGAADVTLLRAPRHALHAQRLQLDWGAQTFTIEAGLPELFNDLMTPHVQPRGE